MRTATISIKRPGESMNALRAGFSKAWKTGKYQGEHFDFESPAALFRVLTPKRWELVEALQNAGAQTTRGLARLLGRDVHRVHDDAAALIEFGLIEKTDDGKLIVPFGEIRTEFLLKMVA